ncbi:hypothetical protein H2201_001498 [Coniosporium apollinis]|uniref:ceramidase n=1 Tax=Coniosporium apollinis TaxID=61459 RepID=A0ABQ9P1L1_9PEZI|nr:hypothetical protein H2201_001498 [Coniosporium apollinis]
MPVVTRSQNARIAAFPDPRREQGNGDDEPQRPLPTENVYTRESAFDAAGTPAEDPYIPPIYTIDLSRPPAERYIELAEDFKPQLLGLTGLFTEVLESFGLGSHIKAIMTLARLFLWRLHSNEQTEELRGICKVTGIDMYLLVAFNTLLDLFMGCTSGGVRVKDGNSSKMLHFRTLDWGMDALRKVVVELEFVDRPHGEVIARSITYAGFVGVLTAVRKNLSISLNFRPNHNESTSKVSNIKFYSHHLLVLLGLRPSISSVLRSYIFASPQTHKKPDLGSILQNLPSTSSTASYVIASDGTTTTVFEKDRITAKTMCSSSFIVATNHDTLLEEPLASGERQQLTETRPSYQPEVTGIEDLIAESIDRKACVTAEWQRAVARYQRRHPGTSEADVCVAQKEVVEWLEEYPITNECTHFATVMDPKLGEFAWVRRYEDSAYTDEEEASQD